MQHLAGGARTHGLRLSRMSSAVDARPEFGDGASHGLGVGHEDGIDESVGVGLVEKAHGEDGLLHGDAVLFAVVGDLHALGVAEDGCEDARERESAMELSASAGQRSSQATMPSTQSRLRMTSSSPTSCMLSKRHL